MLGCVEGRGAAGRSAQYYLTLVLCVPWLRQLNALPLVLGVQTVLPALPLPSRPAAHPV